MDFSRYEKLRSLVRANFSEQTRALVDEALEYADGKLAGLVRYDGSPLLEHAAAVASIVISEGASAATPPFRQSCTTSCGWPTSSSPPRSSSP